MGQGRGRPQRQPLDDRQHSSACSATGKDAIPCGVHPHAAHAAPLKLRRLPLARPDAPMAHKKAVRQSLVACWGREGFRMLLPPVSTWAPAWPSWAALAPKNCIHITVTLISQDRAAASYVLFDLIADRRSYDWPVKPATTRYAAAIDQAASQLG